MHPIGRDDAQHLVDLEDAARSRLEVGKLLVAAVHMHLDRGAVVGEGIQPDVGQSAGAYRHETAHLPFAHEGIDSLSAGMSE